MIKVLKGEYVEDYKLKLIFSTGESKLVDLQQELWGEVFEPLKDKEEFKKFNIKWNTIVWDNGADIAPEWLYENGVDVDSSSVTGTHS